MEMFFFDLGMTPISIANKNIHSDIIETAEKRVQFTTQIKLTPNYI